MASIVVTGSGRQFVFDPVRQCIYCDALRYKEGTSRKLGDEHIICQALGGNIVLPEASCSKCEQEIGVKLEGHLTHKTRGIFASARLRLDYRSKRPKDRPNSLQFQVRDRIGQLRWVDVPAKKVPLMSHGFRTLERPGIIDGKHPNHGVHFAPWFGYHESDFKEIARPGEEIVLPEVTPDDYLKLARMIAKIGHAQCTAAFGHGAFTPLLRDFILGKDNTPFWHYIGADDTVQPETKGHHRVNTACLQPNWPIDPFCFIIARVRLFSRWGGPDYLVAVGKSEKPLQTISALEQHPNAFDEERPGSRFEN